MLGGGCACVWGDADLKADVSARVFSATDDGSGAGVGASDSTAVAVPVVAFWLWLD